MSSDRPPREPPATPQQAALQGLVRVVVEDAQAACRRRDDRARNEARRLVLEAEDRVAELRRAAQDLGRVRGEAADRAAEEAADREIRAVHDGAFEALWQRFRTHVLMRLEALPEDDAYGAALAHWCREAAAKMDGACEVFSARRDRPAVYEALLAAGARDFHVRVDHGVHVGFVVRDLDGRTVIDRRPAALLEAHADDLRALLAAEVPAFEAPQVAEPEAADVPDRDSPVVS